MRVKKTSRTTHKKTKAKKKQKHTHNREEEKEKLNKKRNSLKNESDDENEEKYDTVLAIDRMNNGKVFDHIYRLQKANKDFQISITFEKSQNYMQKPWLYFMLLLFIIPQIREYFMNVCYVLFEGSEGASYRYQFYQTFVEVYLATTSLSLFFFFFFNFFLIFLFFFLL